MASGSKRKKSSLRLEESFVLFTFVKFAVSRKSKWTRGKERDFFLDNEHDELTQLQT